MERAWGWLYRRLGRFYIAAYAVFEIVSGLLITLGTVGLLALYEEVSVGEYWRIVAVAEICVLASMLVSLKKVRGFTRPLGAWMQGRRDPDTAVEAWRIAVSLPVRFVTRTAWAPVVLLALPISVYVTLELDLPWYSVPILFGATLVSVAYAGLLHFFVSEAALRPVVRDIANHVPADFKAEPLGVPLRWRLLGALPLINLITGVVVSGLSTDGQTTLRDLGFDVLVAVGVAFTLSLELTVLLTRSILTPTRELIAATQRVKAGDLSARVPPVYGDELGELGRSFNEMMDGLSEREALREALGTYVDPQVAERVVREGVELEGEEVEVTVAFVDIRDFTSIAERSSARETVAFLSEFFGLAVPIIEKHGGHANKFIGDGILAVFGTPERHADHADRALAAACELADKVEGLCRIGVGINSGPVVVGTVGGGGRLEFTVIGDAVNVAARVQQATRDTGDVVLLTEATRCLLSDGGSGLVAREAIPLKGIAEPVPVYAPGASLPSGPTATSGQFVS
jgi:class 3 adenylate cyclase